MKTNLVEADENSLRRVDQIGRLKIQKLKFKYLRFKQIGSEIRFWRKLI